MAKRYKVRSPLSKAEERSLEQDYLDWRARQIEAGNVPKSIPKYDPSKKFVPFRPESQRKKLGLPLSELEAEMRGFRAARAAGQPISTKRVLDVEREIRRLRTQESDIAMALQQQGAERAFVKESYKWDPRPAAKPPVAPIDFDEFGKAEISTSKARGFRRFLTKRNIIIASGAALGVGLLLSGGEKYNEIEGLHPDSEGIGAMMIRSYTDFGSGWIGGMKALWQTYKDTPMGVSSVGWYNRITNKFAGMPNEGTFAAGIRESHTEFKARFASRWDPMRKLAKQLFKETKEKSAFKQLIEAPEFKTAIREAMETEGEILGKGTMGEVRGFKAQLDLGGRKHTFEFATKKANTLVMADMNKRAIATEAKVLRELGEERAPSLYGTVGDDILVMEKFKGVEELQAGATLSQREYETLSSFMKTAHRKGYTHTDLHGGNIVRAIGESGQTEVAILDWGLSNRFVKAQGIGGRSAGVWEYGKDIIQQEAQKALGTSVTLRQYVQMADLRRLKAHTSKSSVAAEHMGINELVKLSNINETLGVSAEKIAAQKEKFRAAARAVFEGARETKYTGMVAELAEKTVQMSPVASRTAVARPRPKTPSIGQHPPVGNNVSSNNLHNADRGIKQEMAFADTILQDKPIKEIQSVNAYTKTLLQETERRRILKRNRKFQKASAESVGVGLRSANKAGKGHVNFGSTTI